jgi:hypothetical protein
MVHHQKLIQVLQTYNKKQLYNSQRNNRVIKKRSYSIKHYNEEIKDNLLRRVFNIITEVMKNRLLSEEAVGADNYFLASNRRFRIVNIPGDIFLSISIISACTVAITIISI